MRKVIVSESPAGVWNSDGKRNQAAGVVTASEVFHFFGRHERFTRPEINLFDLVSSQKKGLERARLLLGCAKCFDRKSVIWNFPRSYTKR